MTLVSFADENLVIILNTSIGIYIINTRLKCLEFNKTVTWFSISYTRFMKMELEILDLSKTLQNFQWRVNFQQHTPNRWSFLLDLSKIVSFIFLKAVVGNLWCLRACKWFRCRDLKNNLKWKKLVSYLLNASYKKKCSQGSLGSRSHRLHMEIKIS